MVRSKTVLSPAALDQWLVCDAPWVRYRARQMFLGEGAEQERAAVVAHPLVQGVLREMRQWPATSLSDHRAAKDLLNKLALVVDFGVTRGDPGIDEFAERVLAMRDASGRILNHVLMPKRRTPEWLFDIDGQDPLLALVGLGFGADERVRAAVGQLIESAQSGGGWVWPDAVSPLPCRRLAGGCPYPTLKILRILARDPEWAKTAAARKGVELLLQLAHVREVRYGFAFGQRFLKLKYPFVWFDVLHLLEATSPFPLAWKDPRFTALLDGVVAKADGAGCFTPESVWMAWKGQCFAGKKAPSPWLTLIIHRILAREPRRAGRRPT